MADTKITQLQPPQVGYPVVPATDVLPIVVIADPGMATSGSTRKVTVNQLLGAGGTATLASATITGDLTVDTSTLKVDSSNDVVLIGSATKSLYGGNKLEVRGLNIASLGSTNVGNLSILTTDSQAIDKGGTLALGGGFDVTTPYAFAVIAGRKETSTNANAQGYLQFLTTNSGNTILERYRISGDGVATWSNVGGVAGTAMTLNSSGLFLGISSQAFAEKFRVYGSYTLMDDGAFTGFLGKASSLGVSGATTDFGIRSANALIFLSGGATERMRIDSSGNVGIGVAPSAISNVIRLEIGGALSTNLTLRSSSGNASARNWMVGSNVNAFGDFVIRQGNSQGAEPNSGTDRLVIDLNGNPIFTPSSTPATLSANGQLTVNATSNTNLRFSYRGSDGVTRVANLTLA